MVHRRQAVRILALRLLAGVLSDAGWLQEHRLFADAHTAMRWLRAQLGPMANRDQVLREIVRILDPERSPRPWNSHKGTKRELLRLGDLAQGFAPTKRHRINQSGASGARTSRSAGRPEDS